MRVSTLSCFSHALLIHIILGVLLVFSFDKAPASRPLAWPQEAVIKASVIDGGVLQRPEKARREEQEQKALERKAKERQAQERRAQEEHAALKKRQAEAREKQKQLAAEAKRSAEERQAREKRKAALARKRQAEEALREQLAREQAEEQARQDQSLLQGIVGHLQRKVNGNFNRAGLSSGMECVLEVRAVPGGEVVGVAIKRSSGNALFDRRAQLAIEKASPLPLPADPATFDRLKLRSFLFHFNPER